MTRPLRRICWVDDYPTPIRAAVQAALEAQLGVPVDSVYLHASGAHEGRHFPVPALPSHTVGPAVLHRTMATCADEAETVLVCELALPLIPVLLRSCLRRARCLRIAIVGHGPTQGLRALHPKNFVRRIVAWSAPRLFDGCLYYSEMSKRYSRAPRTSCFRVSYGSVLPTDPHDPAAYAAAACDARHNATAAVHVLLAGAWSWRKGFATTVRALGELSTPDRPIVVHHAGDAPLDVQRRFPAVQFHGYLHDAAQLQQLRDRCEVSILASRNEPWGHVVIENMVGGLPTIVTEFCGTADVVRQLDPSLVIPRCTTRDIASAVTHYLSRSTAQRGRLRADARRLAEAHPPDHIADAMVSLIECLRQPRRVVEGRWGG